MSDILEKLKRANSIYPDLLDCQFFDIECPECSNIEDDQYHCTLCDVTGSFDLVELARELLKRNDSSVG